MRRAEGQVREKSSLLTALPPHGFLYSSEQPCQINGANSHFSDEETEADKDSVSLPRVTVQVAELGLRPGSRHCPDRCPTPPWAQE